MSTTAPTKTFLLELPYNDESGDAYPGYVYVKIDADTEQYLNNIREQAQQEKFTEIKKSGCAFATFVNETQDNDLYGSGIIATSFDVHHCDLVVTHYDFWLEFRSNKHSDEQDSPHITFDDLAKRQFDSEPTVTIPLTLQLTAIWDGNREDFECQLNPYNGELEVTDERPLPAIDENNEYKIFALIADGTDFGVFHDQSDSKNDRFFVSPYELNYLLDAVNAETPRPY